jgi:hypothetical protein
MFENEVFHVCIFSMKRIHIEEQLLDVSLLNEFYTAMLFGRPAIG